VTFLGHTLAPSTNTRSTVTTHCVPELLQTTCVPTFCITSYTRAMSSNDTHTEMDSDTLTT